MALAAVLLSIVLVPSAIQQADHALLDSVRDADEAVKRMVDEYKRREGRTTGTPKA